MCKLYETVAIFVRITCQGERARMLTLANTNARAAYMPNSAPEHCTADVQSYLLRYCICNQAMA